jgi:hypothetical protein
VTLQRESSAWNEADQIDGLLTRRELMKRLALVGVTAPTALVAGCSGGRYWPFRRRRRRRR